MHILLVDDDADSSELLLVWIQRQGWTAAHAGAVAEARRELETTRLPFDAVLVDMMLPDGDGLAVLAALAGTTSAGARRIAVTGRDDIDRSAFHAAIVKPVSFEELERALRHDPTT